MDASELIGDDEDGMDDFEVVFVDDGGCVFEGAEGRIPIRWLFLLVDEGMLLAFVMTVDAEVEGVNDFDVNLLTIVRVLFVLVGESKNSRFVE